MAQTEAIKIRKKHWGGCAQRAMRDCALVLEYSYLRHYGEAAADGHALNFLICVVGALAYFVGRHSLGVAFVISESYQRWYYQRPWYVLHMCPSDVPSVTSSFLGERHAFESINQTQRPRVDHAWLTKVRTIRPPLLSHVWRPIV